jgi:periplasmic divalent cation tolerance protein
MTDLVQVLSATPTRESALALARSAVETRLAAGAQVHGPIASAFWHEGQFGTGEEWQVVLKTNLERYPDLEKHLIEQHPWTNPEIIAVPIVAAPAGYLAWARASTSTD